MNHNPRDIQQVSDAFKILFRDHEELSDLIMQKNGLHVKLDELRAQARVGACGPNDQPSVWLRRFTRAIVDEVRELSESIAWKWWRPQNKTDLQNVRVELVDILHFVFSAAAAAGMTGEDLVKTYYEKRALNAKRQNVGFVEGDNKEAGIGRLHGLD